MKSMVALLSFLTLFSLNIFAQDYTRFSLPEGAKARLGKGKINELAYSPDGTQLAVASCIGIWLYDTETHQEVALLTGQTESVISVAFSPDGRTLASGSSDGTIRLWDATTGTHQRTLTGHSYVYSVAFSPDSRTIVAGVGCTIRLWDAVTGAEQRTHTWPDVSVFSVAFSPDNRTIAAGGYGDETIRLWDAVTGTEQHTLTVPWHWVYSVAFSPDSRTIVAASGGQIRLWDAETGIEQHTITAPSYVYSVAFSPDSRTLASGGYDGTTRLWDTVTGVEQRTLTGHSRGVYSVAFSPDGTTLASGSRDGTIRLWDAAIGTEKHTLTGHSSDITSVAFSPDGRTIASGGRTLPSGLWTETIRLWDAQTGAEQRILTEHSSWIYGVAFSPDGRTIATGSYDNTICLWDAETGAHQRTLTAHTSYGEVTFSPDGRTLASGSEDSTIRLWDAQTGTHKRTLTGHSDWVWSVAFSPDGLAIASGSWDGTVLLWEVTPSSNTNATVSISPSPVQSPASGAQLTLSLKIAGGETVAGYQTTVGFDTTALQYVSSANGDYLPTGAFFVPPVVEENRVTLASTALAGVSKGDGTLATITFEVVAIKTSMLTLSQVTLVNPDGERSYPHVENGQVIEPPQLFGDVNRDGVVNIQDLVIVGANFGQTGDNSADINDDGVVDIVDLVVVAGAIRNVATAPAAHPHALTIVTAADVQGWLTQAHNLNRTEATFQRGITFLEHLLATLTPKETALLPNYPNPFNPETWIPYHLAHAADVELTIYDTKGMVVRRFELGHQPAGIYQDRNRAAYWNGRNENGELVASGVYFYQLRAGNYSAVRRMVILK